MRRISCSSLSDTCKPPVISYDNYAIGEAVDFSYGFWANIWDVRGAALRNRIPFHTIILTAAHFNYRVPSPPTCACKCTAPRLTAPKGSHFTNSVAVRWPCSERLDLGNFRHGAARRIRRKDRDLESLRNLNHQIKNLAPVLLNLRSDDVYHIGEIPERNHGLRETNLLSGLEAGEQFIIGEFTHKDGSRWMMIVNKHLKMSTFCRPKFRNCSKEN